jgi:translocation and assembly module TamB
MRVVGKILRWFAAALGVVILILAVAFALLQSRLGQAWLARTVAAAVSDPDFTVAIEGLSGVVPFGMRIARIDIGDRDGGYLVLHDLGLDISAAALLSGRLHIRSLAIAAIDMARLTTAPSTTPWIDYLKVPRLPVAVDLDRLAIARLALAPPVLGESVVATLEGSATVARGKADIRLDLHRTDGAAGLIALAMALAGDPPVLQLKLEGGEPTGALSDRLLARNDRLPLTLSLDGTGPLTDWHGRFAVTAGTLAHLDADLHLAVAADTVFALSGAAAVAPLLPPELESLAGDRVGLSLRARFGERITVDALSIDAAGGSLSGGGAFGGPEKAIDARLRGTLPRLSVLAGLLGQPVEGSAVANATVTGSESHPRLALELSGSALRIASFATENATAELQASSTDRLGNPAAKIDFAAEGRLAGLSMAGGVAVPPELGGDLDWSLAGSAVRDGSCAEVSRLSVTGAGINLSGAGQMTNRSAVDGRLNLSVADLARFSGLFGYRLAGAAELRADAARAGPDGFAATLSGSTQGLRTGIAAADALLGRSPTIAGTVRRDAAGIVSLERLAIAGAAMNLAAEARYDPAANGLTAALTLDLPRLGPLGAALGSELAGSSSAQVKLEGPLDRLRVSGEIEAADLAAAGVKLDRLRLAAQIANLSHPKAVLDGSFHAYGLDGKLALAAERQGNTELVLPRVALSAGDSAIEGSLRVALDSGLARGSIAGRIPDLRRWSKLAGTPLGGGLQFAAGLGAHDGQSLDLSLTGARLTAGDGASAAGIDSLTLNAHFIDVLRAPSGAGRLALRSVRLSGTEFSSANLALDAPRPGRFTFQGEAQGKPLTLALAGDGGWQPGQTELRLTRLSGSLGGDRLYLEQPLRFTDHGGELAFSGLALQFGPGRISGSGGVHRETLSLALDAANLPIASGARLLGYPNMRGALSFAATLGGSLRAPQGRFSLNARDVALAALNHAQPKSLGLAVDGSWNGRNVDLRGRVTGFEGDQIAFSGTAPLLLTPAPLGISMPADGRLAFRLQGAGRLDRLADLLPLGEDRISGRFAADVEIGGTLAAPAANGRLKLSDARYENFASGAVLTNLQAELVGDRDRFTLTSLSAADTAGGTLNAKGNVVLGGASGPRADLSANLAKFRIAARDEAVATATGTVSIAGPLTAPKVTAPLTIDRADITLPENLPPNVVTVKVVEVNGQTGKRPPPAPAAQAPALPALLDLTIDMPGNIFVRGHGLESEWRGKMRITGTSAQPVITGALQEIRGSVDLLGKTFTLTRGAITFDGSAKLDPVLDIVAEASAADITAQVNIGGFASAPTVSLSSTPAVPQDEILARVLFNRGVGQITAGQGLQLAAAAGTLAGGGPGVLDRLRGGLGLDWFRLGSGPTGAASSTLNPRATSTSAAGGTALSAGKYIAPGVSVGVSQGLSPPTSKVTVEIELRPHLTVQGEAGQSGSTGIGLNYNYDY